MRVQNLLGVPLSEAAGEGAIFGGPVFASLPLRLSRQTGFAERLSASFAFQMQALHLGDLKFPLTPLWLSGLSLQIALCCWPMSC